MTVKNSSSPLQSQGGVIQIGSKLIKTSGGLILICRGKNMKNGEEENIFKSSSIRFLLSIEDPKQMESNETSFFLAIGSHRLAVFRLRDGAKFKFHDEIFDHGKITEKVEKEKIFRVTLTILLVFRVYGMRIVEFTIDFDTEEKKLPISFPLLEKFEQKSGEDSNDEENSVKKAKTEKRSRLRKSSEEENQPESMKKKPRGKSNKFTYLECEECPSGEFRTLSASTWVDHLRRKNSTNPGLTGLALLCECGNVSLSNGHAQKCIISEVRVIKTRDAPIRRLHDAKTTPKSALCEAYPKTPNGYIDHLRLRHKSCLSTNKIFLVCSCGLKVRSVHDNVHMKKCDGRQFALRKLNKK